jgi:hypothetical protein
MSHQILLVVSKPERENASASQLWHNLLSPLLKTTNQNKGIQILGQNVVLIDVSKNLDGLSEVVYLLKDNDVGQAFEYRYLILDEEIKWHGAVDKP